MSSSSWCQPASSLQWPTHTKTAILESVQIDERLPALVRLVKAWAGARGLNDASNGTFNSYALTLLVRPADSQGFVTADNIRNHSACSADCTRALTLLLRTGQHYNTCHHRWHI